MLSVFTMNAVAASLKKSQVCYDDMGAVIDCPTEESASSDSKAMDGTADDSATSDQMWI
jgi:hypothetical protein